MLHRTYPPNGRPQTMSDERSAASHDRAEALRRGPRLDPAGAEFWSVRYREGVTPWDAGGVPATLSEFVRAQRAPLRVLVPGCGSAYEVRAFAEAGHDVLAIDFSAPALERAGDVLGEWSRLLRHADFFADDLGAPYDLVYERAFLCALPRVHWVRWAARLAELVAPGGRLAGFFFASTDERGPPFALKPGELRRLLGAGFDLVEDRTVPDSIPVFAGRERWQVWRRR
jgi:SAM-dependent methyltransferase